LEAKRQAGGGERRARATLSVAQRIFASFAVTIVAFGVTVGFALYAERRTAQDTKELAYGYVPVALKLAQLKATQTTLKALVQGVPDERNPASSRVILDAITAARRIRFSEVRQALLAATARGEAPWARALQADVKRIDEIVVADRGMIDRLFAAMADGDGARVNAVLIPLSALEHDADTALENASTKLQATMNDAGVAAELRSERIVVALVLLVALTLSIGVATSVSARRLLLPLGHVTRRAQAVARGDLSPRPAVIAATEIGELSLAFETMVSAVARARDLSLSNERFAAIGKMAAHVTHEIRNPLSSMGLNLELLEEELQGQPSEVRSLITAVRGEVDRLVRLSEEYLRVARLPSPRMECDDLRQTVRDIARFATLELAQAHCSVDLQFDELLPPVLYDPAQIRQALLNLLRNAREAMPSGGPIEVGLRAEGMGVILSVQDSGSGIAPEILERVFEPFFSTKGEGTGLGLAIVKHIVEAHGGAIRCKLPPGGGTRFEIELPIASGRLFPQEEIE
jgi:signal transduction histidine kinase